MRTRMRRVVRTLAVALIVAVSATTAAAQTPFVPYFGKNRIKYDRFDWKIYTTDHFEIYYYPEMEQHLERIAGYAESAYQQISSDLKHDLAFKVPLILFKTWSEFAQQNVIPGEIPEGVAAFAEPQRDRMVLPIDEPPDMLYRLIVHELTHIFEFDIIPRSLIRRGVPLWVDEGLADYLAGVWRPLDLMTVRDAAVADILPKMSKFEGYGEFSNPRLVYNLGHMAFEFIESRWGKEGIRQFLFALRKSVIGGADSAYEEALRVTPEEFDEQFDKYVKDRFKPFRDKERPADYGRDLAPNRDKSPFTVVLSLEPSPSGDVLAAFAGNRKDREIDIILVSTKDGEVIRNLTPGFDQDLGFEYIVTPGARFNTVPWMSWSPKGDRLAYFVRTEKQRSLVLQNVLTRKIEEKILLRDIDAPESPDFSPDGRYVAFSGLRGATGDVFVMDLTTAEITNVTNDEFHDYAPTYSPDGKYLVYLSRISGADKLFRLDLDTKKKTQITFGTHDDAAAQFLDETTIVFPSTATDPTKPIEADVARNGNIYNLWTLNLQTGELRQWTDTLTGIMSPVIVREGDTKRITFVTYFKNQYGVHSLVPKEPVTTAASADFGAPGPVIDFQAPLSHTLIEGNKRRKGAWEKLFLEGRPPVNVGVTSGGDVFGGTAISFTDVLGDKQFNFYAASVSQYRSFAGSYINLERRFQYALQGYYTTQFYYGLQPGVLYDPGFGFLDRDQAIATRTSRGFTAFGIWPMDRYRRFELYGGFVNYKEEYDDPLLQELADQYQLDQFGTTIFRDGSSVPLGVAFVQETTVFREFGPLSGNTMRVAYEVSPKFGDTLSRQTVDADLRYYQRLAGSGLLALRARGFKSWGDFPDFFFFGGNSEMRGYEYLEFVGNEGFFANAELRFPLIEAMLTPIGVLGGVRGTFFFNIGGTRFEGQDGWKAWTSSDEVYTPIVNFAFDPVNGFTPVFGDPVAISGFRLRDARASYGVGLQTFALGFPIHFDWSWRTLFNKEWEDALFALSGGSSAFRKARFDVWIGFDF
ncbi:MAG: PD40 domain-containing protein, partial [Vicinamibacteraceae bacterium]|nr:PD40 domain-containing protein [Vicinamibacteraceae bacterium]